VAPTHRRAPTLDLPSEQRELLHARAATHRVAPTAPTAHDNNVLTTSNAPSAVLASPPEKLRPRLSRTLAASVDVREMAYRLQQMVEARECIRCLKFDALCYRTLTLFIDPRREEPTVEQRLARAAELSVGRREHTLAPQAPLPLDYSTGLRSQQPRKQTTVYFLKVDALWSGGFGQFHLRVRVVPPVRQPLGVPCAISPLGEGGLALEGVIRGRASTPLEPFAAQFSQLHEASHSTAARLARSTQLAAGPNRRQ